MFVHSWIIPYHSLVYLFILSKYVHHYEYVQWDGAHTNMFKILNGLKQGSVISPLLLTLYIDSLFLLLKQLDLGCHVGLTYVDAFGYADDIALVAPSFHCLKKMINSSSVVPVFINGKRVEVVQSDVHLGN